MRPDVITDEGAVDDDEEDGEEDDEGDDEPEDWWTYWQDPPDDVPDDSHEKPLRMTAKEKVGARRPLQASGQRDATLHLSSRRAAARFAKQTQFRAGVVS